MQRETGLRVPNCDTAQKNGGKNNMKSDAKKRLLRENIKIFQPTFRENKNIYSRGHKVTESPLSWLCVEQLSLFPLCNFYSDLFEFLAKVVGTIRTRTAVAVRVSNPLS